MGSGNEAAQEQTLAELDRSEFLTNYHNPQIWDLLSLYLCTTDEPQNQIFETVPIDYKAANGNRMLLTPRDTDHIRVEPYAFNVGRSRSITSTSISKLTISQPFREAYYAAVPKLRHFELE